ncbi:MAG: hypothetical protein IJ525_07320 [Alphaproteobacteria bacterium]|nr:hypothetical protein [Alphaproteobacteria bacterium]
MRNLEVKNETGRSMIEMLGVLAIIGVLSVGGIAGYSKAMLKYRINRTIEQITQISQNVRTFFATQGNYDGAECICVDSAGGRCGTDTLDDDGGCQVIRKAKLVPDDMLTIDNGKIKAISNSFGGLVSLKPDFWSDGRSIFEIGLEKLPQEACIELVTKDWSLVSSGYLALQVLEDNGSRRWDYGYMSDVIGRNNRSVVSLDEAITVCEDNSNLYMVFE